MTDPRQPPSPEHLADCDDEEVREELRAALRVMGTPEADVEARKRTLRAARELAEERPAVFDRLAESLEQFLTDEERAVRLTAAKLFVTLAESEPALVVPAVEALAGRLADDTEFYYVRARSAEALGYVALDYPEPVSDPDILADFRIGLSFDEPEVKEKLAKGLEYVALGDPNRLRHQVGSLAEHLDDENELVRYHLCTALVAVGSEYPGRLHEATEPLRERLHDESPYVRGRAAEALGQLAASDEPEPVPELEEAAAGIDEPPAFLTDRVRFARRQLVADDQRDGPPGAFGTVESVRASTDAAVEAMATADTDACPQCGLDLPTDGPPMCPRCGAPR